MTISTYAYQGSGIVSMKKWGAAAGKVPVGNVSKLEFTVEEEVKKQKNYMTAAGGTYATSRMVKNVGVTMTVHDLNPANLSRAVFGDVRAVTGAAVTDEAMTLYKGALCETAYPLISAATVQTIAATGKTITLTQTTGTATATSSAHGFLTGDTVMISGATPDAYNGKKTILTADTGTFTFAIASGTTSPPTGTITAKLVSSHVENVDFALRQTGLWIPEDSGIADATATLVSYTYGAANIVEALTSGSDVWSVTFEGLNLADSARPMPIIAHRIQLGASKSLSLIGDDLASLELSGDVLIDESITGEGLSKYFQVIQQAA